MDTEQVERLRQIVSGGAVEFIFEAEQSLSLIEACGANQEFLKKHNFGELFGTIQGLAINQFVLSVTKIYEKPSKRYPNVSLPSVLDFVAESSEKLKLLEPGLVRRGLEILEIAASGFDAADTEAKKNAALAQCLRASLPDVENHDALRALKTLRDKKIAHPEDIDLEAIEKTTWEHAEKLLILPRGIVGILGDAYLATAYWDEKGSYLASIDGSRVGRAMNRLVKAADNEQPGT